MVQCSRGIGPVAELRVVDFEPYAYPQLGTLWRGHRAISRCRATVLVPRITADSCGNSLSCAGALTHHDDPGCGCQLSGSSKGVSCAHIPAFAALSADKTSSFGRMLRAARNVHRSSWLLDW